MNTVEFFNAPYTVEEGSGAYNVCLNITPACDIRTDVTIGTSPKDALRKLLCLAQSILVQ